MAGVCKVDPMVELKFNSRVYHASYMSVLMIWRAVKQVLHDKAGGL